MTKTLLEQRQDQVRQMREDLAMFIAMGKVSYVAILTSALEAVEAQIAAYNPAMTTEEGEAHFFEETVHYASPDYWAYGQIGKLQMQEAVNAEIVATFHRGEIEAFQIFADIAEDLAMGGPNETIDVDGYVLRHDGEFIVMTAPTGEARSFPIPRIA